MIPVILSGGTGSRLWPLSRGMYPKQLLPIAHPDLSLLQQTVLRANGILGAQSPVIVCNEEHRFIVGEQLSQLQQTNPTIILEPVGRNTAPAIALAALEIVNRNPDASMLVMPADHVVLDAVAFHQAVELAQYFVNDGKLVTFGVVPTAPEIGYGYIRRGRELTGGGYVVDQFKEKPDLALAQEYVKSGEFYWNGGIFAFKAQAFLDELGKFSPDVLRACELSASQARPDLDFIRVAPAAFEESPSISVDYAVMEHTKQAVVVPLNAGWSDVGSWSALWEVSDKDASGNAVTGDVLLHNTRNTHIYSETKLVSAVGVDDLVIVETDDAVLVSHRDQCQDVKEIVKQLENANRSQTKHHRKVYRPWGWYDSIDVGDRFQVKRIHVKPGAKLSVQMHHHRAEHWVVVKGVAVVLNGEETRTLNENESTYIPIGVKHALSNPSETELLEIIEVQTGSYLGEDDIVRFEDEYGRA